MRYSYSLPCEFLCFKIGRGYFPISFSRLAILLFLGWGVGKGTVGSHDARHIQTEASNQLGVFLGGGGGLLYCCPRPWEKYSPDRNYSTILGSRKRKQNRDDHNQKELQPICTFVNNNICIYMYVCIYMGVCVCVYIYMYVCIVLSHWNLEVMC